MSEKQDWFWSGNSLMNNLPDKFASEHVLVLRDDITPPSDEHKALIASAPGMAATIATQAAQIESLHAALVQAEKFIHPFILEEHPKVAEQIKAALSNTGKK